MVYGMIGYYIGEIGEFMMTKSEISIEEIDWECLHLLAKKQNIPVPELIGEIIATRLEDYEDFQDAVWLENERKKGVQEGWITLEEYCQKNAIQL